MENGEQKWPAVELLKRAGTRSMYLKIELSMSKLLNNQILSIILYRNRTNFQLVMGL